MNSRTLMMTSAEMKMWIEDTGGWFRDQITEQATQYAIQGGFAYACLAGPHGVVLAPFSVL